MKKIASRSKLAIWECYVYPTCSHNIILEGTILTGKKDKDHNPKQLLQWALPAYYIKIEAPAFDAAYLQVLFL